MIYSVMDFQSARLGLAAEHPDPYRAAAPTLFAGSRAEALCGP
jgi:hypothetical protein